MVLPVLFFFLSKLRFTGRPTIKFASSLLDTFFGSASPTIIPALRILILSQTSLTSCSLWVINIIAFPLFLRAFIILNNSFTSCGVKTAVGSSKIINSADLNNTLIISTLCCAPTESLSVISFGFTRSEYFSLISVTFFSESLIFK